MNQSNSAQVIPAEHFDPEQFANFVLGKTIIGLRLPPKGAPFNGVDLIFSDQTTLELSISSDAQFNWLDLYPGEGRGLDPEEDGATVDYNGWRIVRLSAQPPATSQAS
jgi:hypothetical protein